MRDIYSVYILLYDFVIVYLYRLNVVAPVCLEFLMKVIRSSVSLFSHHEIFYVVAVPFI